MRSRADPGSVTGSVGGVALFGMRERDAVHSVSMAFVSVWIYRSSEDRRVKGPDEFLSSLTDPGDCQRMSLDLGALGAKDASRLAPGHVAPAIPSLFFKEPMNR